MSTNNIHFYKEVGTWSVIYRLRNCMTALIGVCAVIGSVKVLSPEFSHWGACRSGGCGFDPCWVQQHSFMQIDHEILFMVILSLPLIQEEQLSVSAERMCSSTC